MSVTRGKDTLYPYNAAADLSAKQYLFAGLEDTNNQVNVAGAGAATLGVIVSTGDAAGEPIGIAKDCHTFLYVDGSGTAIVRGDPLKSDANGKGVKAGTDHDKVGAVADAASTAAGDLIPVIVPMTWYERSV